MLRSKQFPPQKELTSGSTGSRRDRGANNKRLPGTEAAPVAISAPIAAHTPDAHETSNPTRDGEGVPTVVRGNHNTRMKERGVVIPISFIDEAPFRSLAVDEEGLRRLLGYERRSPAAAKSASWAFRSKFGIRTLPGGVYSIAEIKKALETTPERRRNG